MGVAVSEKTIYRGGTWEDARGESIDVANPATEEQLASIPSATDEIVDKALASAREAQKAWGRTPATARAGYLRKIADVVAAEAESLAETLVKEGGKPLAQAQGEIEWTVDYIRYTAEWARRIEGDIVPSDNEDEVIHLARVPIGVIAAICPWNYPIALYFRKLAPALITGNTVVLKPSEVTPLSSIQVTKLIDDHVDLPPGVLNLVTGGAETGQAMVRSKDTNMVSMTGHRNTGKKIMADAARNLTRVSLELGGKAPAIVWQDADISRAVEAMITARFEYCGQVCTCVERVFVHGGVFDEFVSQYCAAVERLRIGNPMGDVDIGPVVNATQLEKTEASVATALGEGARLAIGGQRPTGKQFERGFWYTPTVFVDVSPHMDIMTEEIFGPVLPVMRVESLTEALEYANDSPYGLSAYLFTSDYETVMRTAADLEVGELYINRTHGEAVQAHHIGYKESGLGGEDGKYGVLKYTQIKTVYHNYGR